MKSLQEKLDEVALALEPVLWEILDEIDKSQYEDFLLSIKSFLACIIEWFLILRNI